MNPLISIILPVYNGEKYLASSMESVLNQTYSNWELLVINDGSTDASSEIVQRYSDARIRYFEQPNQGVSAARNLGLKNMVGSFFCFLDADDRLTNNSLEARIVCFEDPKIHFVDGSITIQDETMERTIETRIQTFKGDPLPALLTINMTCFFGSTWMIRRMPDRPYQFKEGLTHGEDLLFYMSIATQGQYSSTSEVIYQCRSGNVSAMSNLHGLWAGYKAILFELKENFELSRGQVSTFKRKITSIMIKSYLGNNDVLSAFKVARDYFRI